MNPFTERHMIKNPANFFGREEKIRHIINRLENLQGVSIVGERRIGKSSLLYYIYQKGQELLGQNYHFVYIDMHDARYQTTGNFFKRILESKQISFSPEEAISTNLINFAEKVEELKENGVNLVLLIDEFENIIDLRQEFPEQFFEQMRSLINNGMMGMITISKASLRNLCLDGNLTSPFYTVFSTTSLEEFTEEEANKFIVADRGIPLFSREEIRFIISYNQYYHPLVLQIICYWLVENRTMGYNDITLESEITHEVEHFFERGFVDILRRNRSLGTKNK